MSENLILIKPLGETHFEVLYETFKKAFADYVEPFDLTIDQLKYMIERRGCNLNLSFGAFHKTELVGITLNGIGEWEGKLTAYDTGTGIIKEYRQKGIATKLFNDSLPILRKNKITQYLLEVICSNTSAYELYKKAGFKVVREFDYYLSPIDEIKNNVENAEKEFKIIEIKKPDWEVFKSFWDFNPSWQNSIDSINRKIDYFKILGISKNDNLIGYGIIEKFTGDIPQFAISKTNRREGAASYLFDGLVRYSDVGRIKIINSESSYLPLKKFTESISLPNGIGQYEMLMKL